MQFTPDYTIHVDEQEVNFLFNTRALRLYCQSQNLELSEFYQKVQKAITDESEYTDELKAVKDFVPPDMQNLLYYGHESWCAYKSEPFNVNDLTKDLWIDAIGGLQAQKEAFAAIIIAIVQRMVAPGEKKSQTMTEQPTAAEVMSA